MALIYLYHGGTDGLTSISGAGLTWTARANFSSTLDASAELHVWTGISASPSAGALTITPVDTATDHIRWVILDLPDASTTPFVQSVTAQGTSTSATATLSAFGSASNTAIAWTWMGNADTMVPEAGYTELFDSAGEFGGTSHVMYRADNGDLTPAVTLGTSAAWAMIAVEVQASGGGGGGGGATGGGMLNMFRGRIQVNP